MELKYTRNKKDGKITETQIEDNGEILRREVFESEIPEGVEVETLTEPDFDTPEFNALDNNEFDEGSNTSGTDTTVTANSADSKENDISSELGSSAPKLPDKIQYDVALKVGAKVFTINEKGNMEFGKDGVLETEISLEKVKDLVHSSLSTAELINNLKGMGVNVTLDNARVNVLTAPEGTVLFIKPDPEAIDNGRNVEERFVIDQPLTDDILEQIENTETNSEVVKILKDNKLLKDGYDKSEIELDHNSGLVKNKQTEMAELTNDDRGPLIEDSALERSRAARIERANRGEGMDKNH